MGPGNDGPPPETIVGLPRNLGADVRDVMDDKLGGPIMPELFDVKWLQGESLMTRLASFTILCRGFISCFTSKLRSLWSFPCCVYAAASSPQACIKSVMCHLRDVEMGGQTFTKPIQCCQNSG